MMTDHKRKLVKRIGKVLFYLLIVTSVVSSLTAYNMWSQNNRVVLQSPIILRTPVYIEHVERSLLSPIAEASEAKSVALTKEQMIAQAVNAEVLHKVNILETSRGKDATPNALHNYCFDRGLSNEFGYDPFNKHCFDSFAESVAVIDGWFTKALETMSLEQALCYYNTGYMVAQCDYVAHYKTL